MTLPTYAELEGLYGEEYLELWTVLDVCPSCNGHGRHSMSHWEPDDIDLGECACCKGTGYAEFETEPVTLEDLESST